VEDVVFSAGEAACIGGRGHRLYNNGKDGHDRANRIAGLKETWAEEESSLGEKARTDEENRREKKTMRESGKRCVQGKPKGVGGEKREVEILSQYEL